MTAPTCQHTDESGTSDCEATATKRFLIMGVPAFACDEHLPEYATGAVGI